MSNLTLRMTIRTLIMTSLLILSLASNALAQDGEKRVMILKFDTLDVDTEVMDTFYKELNASIEDHDEKTVVPGGEVSINEMVVTVGCEGPTPECLAQLQDFVEADQLLFGSVQSAEDVHLFTVRLFDFESQSFEAEIEDQTVDGDMARLSEAIPALIDGLFYGDVGVLEVTVSGADDVDLFLDGEKVGKSSTVMENLPLGEHVLMARSAEGEEQTQQVLLKRGTASQASFTFGGGGVAPDDGDRNKLLIPGVGLIAAGVVGVAFGAVQYAGHRNDAAEMNNMTTCVDPVGADPASEACNAQAFKSETTPGDRARYADLEESQGKKYTRSLVGFGLGAVAVAAGGALIYIGAQKKESQSASVKTKSLGERIKVQVVTTKGYQGLQLNGSF